jgi:hypothetical protein
MQEKGGIQNLEMKQQFFTSLARKVSTLKSRRGLTAANFIDRNCTHKENRKRITLRRGGSLQGNPKTGRKTPEVHDTSRRTAKFDRVQQSF